MLPATLQLSNLLGLLYDAASDPQCWENFLASLANSTHAQSAVLPVSDGDIHGIQYSWRFDPELMRIHAEYYHSIDPWWIRGGSLPAGTVRTSQSLLSVSEFKKTEAYNDCLNRFDVLHGVFACLENRPRLSAALSLFRSPSAPEFGQSEKQILEILAPHLQRAFRLHFQLSYLKARAASFESALDACARPALLLDARGSIVYMNHSAAALLAEKDGLLTSANTLLAERRAESDLLQAAIRSAAAMSPHRADLPGGALFISRRSRPALQVFLAPIRAGALGAPARASVAVFVTDPLRAQRPTLQTLRSSYGLTPAESRVALLLADGHSPRQISAMLAVTEHTIRSQIKAIFAKTGVRRQSELVRLLLTDTGPRL